MALRSQRPRVLLAGFRLQLLGQHLCAHYSSRDLGARPKGELACETGDGNCIRHTCEGQTQRCS